MFTKSFQTAKQATKGLQGQASYAALGYQASYTNAASLVKKQGYIDHR
jgi:hypothetical protein